MYRNIIAIILFYVSANAASAQNMQTGTVIYIDACDRHRIQMAEIIRGAGANSNNVSEFAFFVEINGFINAYNSFLGYFENFDSAVELILSKCADDPTRSIFSILYDYHFLQILRQEAERRRAEAQKVESAD